MSQLGADAEALDALARHLSAAAEQIDTSLRSLSVEVGEVWWQGADADRFRDRWTGQSAKQLGELASRMAGAATQLANDAALQRQTSRG